MAKGDERLLKNLLAPGAEKRFRRNEKKYMGVDGGERKEKVKQSVNKTTVSQKLNPVQKNTQRALKEARNAKNAFSPLVNKENLERLKDLAKSRKTK